MNHFNWKSLLACVLMLGAAMQARASLPAVALLATDPTALEGTTTGSFTLIRYGDTNDPLAVNVKISGTASNGVDYTLIGATLTIPAGYLALDIPVQPIADTANRGNKTVVLTLERNEAYHVLRSPRATVKIIDDVFNIPPPTIALTSPADDTSYTSPSSITLEAEVSDPDLPIKSVSFYANDDLLGRVTSSPYTFVWNHPRKGTYALFSRAVDESGKSAVSTPVDITVTDSPVVTITSDAQYYVIGDPVMLSAQIADPTEKISSVTFSVNNKVVGTATSAPFNFTWTAASKGNFTIQAVATDKTTGKKSSSNKIEINVAKSIGTT